MNSFLKAALIILLVANTGISAKNDSSTKTKKNIDITKKTIMKRRTDVPSMSVLDRSIEELKKMGYVETYDSNKDNKPDLWVYYEYDADTIKRHMPVEKKKILLMRKDLDLNYDGKVDIKRQYHDGQLIREAADYDYDGKFDAISLYKQGEVILKEFDFQGDGKTDVWKYYEDAKLILKEVDNDFDGKVDMWVYFKNDKIIQIAKDVNKDGTPDKWTK